MDSHIRPVRREDSKSICEIYNYYVVNTNISFEEQPISEGEMERRIVEKTKKYPWLVYVEEGEIVGYSYVGNWKERSAYRHTVEDTIYVKTDRQGKGIGQKLFEDLLEAVGKDKEIHAIIAVIALPNEKSVAIHERNGFEKVAHFEEVGYKNDTWIDVGYWEKVIDI